MDKVSKEITKVNETMVSRDVDMDSRLFNMNDVSAISGFGNASLLQKKEDSPFKEFGSFLGK